MLALPPGQHRFDDSRARHLTAKIKKRRDGSTKVRMEKTLQGASGLVWQSLIPKGLGSTKPAIRISL